MTPDAFKEACERFKYPKTTFSFERYGWEADIWVFTIQIAGVKDMFTGEIGPLTFRFMFTDKSLLVYDEKDAKEWIHTKLQELLVHEMNEQLEYGDDRPWYPHGAWSERKHLVVKPEPPEWLEINGRLWTASDGAMMDEIRRHYNDELEKRLYEERSKELIARAANSLRIFGERPGSSELSREEITEIIDAVPSRVGSEDREVAGREVIYESLSDSRNYAEPQTAEVAAQEDIRREPPG